MFSQTLPLFYTADMGAALAFYLGILGGTQSFQFPAEGEPEHVEFRLGDITVAVTKREAVTEMGMLAPSAGHPLELVLVCASVDRTVEHLRSAGVPIVMEPIDHVAGHRRAYVSDPDGNWIAITDSGETNESI